MTSLSERLADAQARSVKLYLQRTRLEEARQQIQSHARQVDMELLKNDGEVDILTALLKESNG